MTNELKVFENAEFGSVRTLEENGRVLFCGSDVAKSLGYSNTRDALSKHCKGVVKCDTLTNGGVQLLSFITEGDVYRLITHSKLPRAERFEVWVFDEVLPTIHKYGTYMTNEVIERTLTDPDYLIQLATALKEERQARQLAEQKAKTLDNENKILSSEVLEWADRDLINAIVRKYAYSACDGIFGKAWNNFKKELLYKYGINLNSRITKYLNDSGKKTKPKTLDMLDDSEVSDALKTIVSLCRENNVEIGDLLNNTNTI